MKKVLSTIVVLSSVSLGVGAYASAEKQPGEVGGPLPQKLAAYELTGDVETCFKVTRIKSSRPVDDRHLVFRMKNGDRYLNRLGAGCSGLRFEGAYTYKTGLAKLCSLQIIDVINTSTGSRRGSCGLGKFEKIQKVASAE